MELPPLCAVHVTQARHNWLINVSTGEDSYHRGGLVVSGLESNAFLPTLR